MRSHRAPDLFARLMPGVRDVPELPARPRVALHAKQLAFMSLPHFIVLYGGAAGGGKTEAILADAFRYTDHPHYKALILRRTFRELNLPGSIMHRALSMYGREYWREKDKRFEFPSGAVVQFGYCDHESHLDQYQSTEFHRIYIDELTEWPEGWFRFLFSRIRSVEGDPIPLAFRAGTNPGGIGGEWVREFFHIPEGEVVQDPILAGGSEGERYFLPARIEDNPTINLAAYERSLAVLGPAKFEQLRWGRWVRDGQGLVYGAFSSANVIARAPEGITRTLLAQDYGFKDATSWTILGWRPHDPNVYVLRSWKRVGVTPSENAEAVRDLEKQWRFQRIVGDVGGLGKGYAEEAIRRFKLPIKAAEKNNKRGYIDLFNGDLKRGRILIVNGEGECADLVHEYKTLPWHEKRQKEAEGFANHCADGTLYGWRECTAFMEQPEEPKPAAGTPEAWSAEADKLRTERLKAPAPTHWWQRR